MSQIIWENGEQKEISKDYLAVIQTFPHDYEDRIYDVSQGELVSINALILPLILVSFTALDIDFKRHSLFSVRLALQQIHSKKWKMSYVEVF